MSTPDARGTVEPPVLQRPVTLVVSDLQGSTALAERLDAETLRAVLSRYFDEMRLVLSAHGGSVVKIIGDAIVTVFATPQDPTEAARHAAAAVVEGQDALDALNDRLEQTWGVRLVNRTGIASGLLSTGGTDGPDGEHDGARNLGVRDGGRAGERDGGRAGERDGGRAGEPSGVRDTVLAGAVVAIAESLEAAAPPFGALLDDATCALAAAAVVTEAAGEVRRKGDEGTIAAWRLVAATAPPAGAGAGRAEGRARWCDTCGALDDAGARRCAGCGMPLAAADTARESRRTVTILFADPRPRFRHGAPSPAQTREVMARYAAVVRPILERHGGTVEKFIGDAVMAVFGLPVRNEDDALRAIRAASEVQAALGPLNDELDAAFGARLANPIGVNTGSVVAGDATTGERLVTGDAVNVAARLEQTAGPGEVILGELTRVLAGPDAEVEALEPLTLKGKRDPVPAYRLRAVAAAGASRRDRDRHQLPLVGRTEELAALRAELRTAIQTGRARRVTLLGDAGVGKSRLTGEFLSDPGAAARVVGGSCLAYGDGITFWPLLTVVQRAAGIAEDDDAATARRKVAELAGADVEITDRLATLAGLGATPYAVGELVWAVRRLLEHLAADTPIIVLIDDVHWAEPTLLDALEELTNTVAAPVLLLCTARPTLADGHPAFVEAVTAIPLRPFDDEQCAQFLRLVLGDANPASNDAGKAPADTAVLEEAVVDRIVEAAGGNPLFLEQLLSMLVDDGRLRSRDGHWQLVGDLSTLEVPATVEALLAARLDRLPPNERRVIEPASVIGRRFETVAVVHLVDEALEPHVPGHLDDLARRDLLEHLPASGDGDRDGDHPAELHRFQHQLIRDATYNGLLKEVRAVLHERFVAWGDEINEARDRATEYQEIQGYHLEQAYRYWRELGPLDDHVVALGIDAARRLGAAGGRALTRGDMPAAARLCARASALLPDGHVDRPLLLLRTGQARHETGAFDEAIAAYEAATAAADASGDAGAAEAGRIEALRLRYLSGRLDEDVDVAATVDAVLDRLTVLDDPNALSRAWQLRLSVDIAACRWDAAQHAAEQVLHHARRADNTTLEVRTLPMLAFLAQKGPMAVAEATTVCREILVRVAFDRRSTGLAQLDLALLSAMSLDLDDARRLSADTRRVLVELGWEMRAAMVSLSSGPIELLADEPARAEAELRRDHDALDRMGERNFITLTAVLLADAVYRQRRFDEASELVAFARRFAAPDDLAVQIIAASVDGKLAARRGDHTGAVALAVDAVALIDSTADPSGQGDARLDLAEVLFVSGEVGAALAAAQDAADRYRRKGNLLGLRRAERVAAAIATGRDPLG